MDLRKAVALLLLPSVAFPSDWQFVTTSIAGTVVTVEVTTVITIGNRRKAWVKYLEPAPVPIPSFMARGPSSASSYRYWTAMTYVDCLEKISAITQSAYFTAEGELVGSYEMPRASIELTEAPPDSIGATIMAKICALKSPS